MIQVKFNCNGRILKFEGVKKIEWVPAGTGPSAYRRRHPTWLLTYEGGFRQTFSPCHGDHFLLMEMSKSEDRNRLVPDTR